MLSNTSIMKVRDELNITAKLLEVLMISLDVEGEASRYFMVQLIKERIEKADSDLSGNK